MLLEELKPGLRIEGLIPAEVITVIYAQWHGADALELTYKTPAGALGQQVVFRKDEDKLSVAQTGSRAFDAAGVRLQARRPRRSGSRLAGLFDPMLAVATSDVRAAAAPDPGRLRRAAPAHPAALPAGRRPRRRQDDHGRPLHQGAAAARRPEAVPDRRARRPGGAVAGRAVLQVRAAVRPAHQPARSTPTSTSTSSRPTRC